MITIQREGKVYIQGKWYTVTGHKVDSLFQWIVNDSYGQFKGKFFSESGELPSGDEVKKVLR